MTTRRRSRSGSRADGRCHGCNRPPTRRVRIIFCGCVVPVSSAVTVLPCPRLAPFASTRLIIVCSRARPTIGSPVVMLLALWPRCDRYRRHGSRDTWPTRHCSRTDFASTERDDDSTRRDHNPFARHILSCCLLSLPLAALPPSHLASNRCPSNRQMSKVGI